MIGRPYHWKAIALIAVAFACWYVVAYIRTQRHGTQWSDLLSFSLVFFCLFAFPILLVTFWGSSFRHAWLGAFALTIFSIGGAEAFARAQEQALINKFGKHPSYDFTVPRWFPFENSCIGYASSVGWWGCD